MKRTIKTACFFLAFAWIIGFLAGNTLAQTTTGESAPDNATGQTVADVSIYDAKVINQTGSSFTIEFDFYNGQGVQPGVKYSVRLFEKQDGNNYLVDEQTYDEVINLRANETFHKQIEYQAPTFFSGQYELWMHSEKESGLNLANTYVADVTLSGSGEYVKIYPDTCHLSVSGDQNKYGLLQGVDISKDEKLTLVCSVENKYNKEVSAKPFFDTYYRVTIGDLLSTTSQEAVLLDAQAKKEVGFLITVPDEPQAYDSVLVFKDESGNVISNELTFHYVLQGPSATIQSLSLDKDYYAKGDTAKVSYLWTPSADSFPDARGNRTPLADVTLGIALNDAKGQACASLISKKASELKPGELTLSLPVSADCIDPVLIAQIVDNQGKVLASEDARIKSQLPEGVRETVEGKNAKPTWRIYVLIALLIPGIAVLLLIFRRNRIGLMKIFFLMIIAASMFLYGEQASALTKSYLYYCASDTGCRNGEGGYTLSVTANLNKNTFMPGEEARLSVNMNIMACTNGFGGQVTCMLNGQSRTLQPWSQFDYFLGTGSTFVYDHTESTPGNYNARCHVTAYAFAGTVDDWFNLPYTVAEPPCSATSWSPDPSTVCSGEVFTQTSNCETTRSTTGTKNCAPVNTQPQGYLDSAACSAVQGWAWDPDTSSAINVHLYSDGPAGGGGTYRGSYKADLYRSDLGFAGYDHGFNFAVPAALRDGNNHSLYIYAIDSAGGANSLLGNCPRTINCAPAPTLNFTADASPVAYNGSTTLRWTTTNATSCTASNGWTGVKAAGGGTQLTGNLTVTRTYTLECWNSDGVSTGQKSVTVNVAAAPTMNITADNSAVAYGGSTTVRWTTTNTTSCWASNGWTNWKSHTGDSEPTGSLTAARTYTLECWNSAGYSTGQKSVTVNVGAVPSLNFTADNSAVAYGGSTTLRWTTVNTTSCTASNGWTGAKAVGTGSESTGSLTAARTYTLECWNSAGASTGQKNVTVSINNTCTPLAGFINSVLCPGDETGLTEQTSRTLKDTAGGCTDGAKCEHYCPENYHPNASRTACAQNGICTGDIPANATLCTDDDKNLAENDSRVVVDSCSDGRKCEFTCKPGFRRFNGQCITERQYQEIQP